MLLEILNDIIAEIIILYFKYEIFVCIKIYNLLIIFRDYKSRRARISVFVNKEVSKER